MAKPSVDHMVQSAASEAKIHAIVLALVSTHRCEWLLSVGHFGVVEFLEIRLSFWYKINIAYNERMKAE
jgi:hypothetical protein